MTEAAQSLTDQIQNQVKDFYGNALGQTKGQLESTRSQLEEVAAEARARDQVERARAPAPLPPR